MTIHRENFNHFVGPIIANPLKGAGPDTQIIIEQGKFVPNDPPGDYPVYDMAHFDGVLLSVHFTADTWNTVEGSAVMVAPGIAFTAAHVVEPLIDEIMASAVRIFCMGLTPSGPRHWRVRQIVKANGTDLMILSLDYASPIPPDGRFVQAVITTRLPKIGELVMIAGFRAACENVPDADFPYFPVSDGHLQYGAEVRIGIGEVTQHHLGGRGSMAPGPAIEVACSTPGGLSGGPAFDQNGILVGILSASVTHADGSGHSQVSLLVPALVQMIEPAFLDLYPGPIRLLDLDPDLCGIDGRDAIHSATDPETGIIRLEISGW